ncbi:MAG: S-layer homology domain-containing protein, partial [Clostridiales bacterium]|nr:S-layer homology domain-containing protein [Clostridiales bacterium]
MRKMSKGLSFVLVLALILGSFSMVSAAVTAAPGDIAKLSDIEGILGQEEIEVCQYLGIITGNPDGTYLPDKDVNRAEFAAIITRTMGIPESALAGFSTTSFLDTSGYGWAVPYLAYCHSKGIMLGDGHGNAMPGRTITVNEAMTMICRALGYVENSALLTGSWPSNYITLAQNLWLYDKLDRNVSLMTKEMSAIAIYNALMTQKVAVATDGKTEFQWVEYPNTSAEKDGVIACFLNTGLECDFHNMFLGDDLATPSNSLIGIVDKIGAYGIAFFTKDDELIAFKMANNFQLLTGYIDGNSLIANDGKKYSFSESMDKMLQAHFPVFVENGEFYSCSDALSAKIITTGAVKGSDNGGKLLGTIAEHWTDGEMLTISGKVSGLTIREVWGVVGWVATETGQIASADLRDIEEDDALFGLDLPLDYYSEVAEKQISMVGIDSIEDLAVDDVVYVYATGGTGDVIRIAASNDTVEGTIDEVSVDDDYVVIDGEEYGFSADYLVCGDGASVSDVEGEVGSDAEALLDAYGNIYDIDATGGELGMFGVVEFWGDGSANGDSPFVRLTNRDEDSLRHYFVGKKVKWYDTTISNTGGSPKSFGTLANLRYYVEQTFNGTSGSAISNDAMYNRLVGYKLNSADQISEFKVGLSIGSAAPLTIKSRTVASVGGKDYKIDKNAAVFFFDGDDIGTSTVANIDLEKAKNMSNGAISVVFSRDGKTITAMLITDKAANATSDSVFGVVNSVTFAASGGDDYTILRGLFDGDDIKSLSTTTGLGRIETHGYL